jgi:soluble lytic murein transglycosylase-like protein
MVVKWRFCKILLVFTVWQCAIPGLARAEIYSYTDKGGKIHLANRPSGRIVPLRRDIINGYRTSLERGPASFGNSRYDNLIRRAAEHYMVRFGLIKAVIHAESGFNNRAVSRKGAMGLMQLMPGTARDLGIRDVFDPEQNIRGGTRYLKRMLELYNDNLRLSLAAYNAGPAAVDRIGGVPPFPETHDYIRRVLSLMRVYGSAGFNGADRLYRVIKNGTVMLSNRPLP